MWASTWTIHGLAAQNSDPRFEQGNLQITRIHTFRITCILLYTICTCSTTVCKHTAQFANLCNFETALCKLEIANQF